jgi:uncharacterized protein YndB with AHSA1/START domain
VRLQLGKHMLTATLAVAGMVMIEGCGASLDRLNKLAASGSIDENAPVVVHLQIEIAAPPAKVWKLLVNASAWPAWQKQIETVALSGPIGPGRSFTWNAGGLTIHSQVQFFDPELRLAWTGTALTAKAVHVWELVPEPFAHTLVKVKESMDGAWMAAIYPSKKLAGTAEEWLVSLKRAAERD